LKEHIREHSEYGKVCELPHKQQLPHSILQLLPYSDYSIISLKQVIDNLYDAEYYTTRQWASKTPSQVHELLQSVPSNVAPANRPIGMVRLLDLAGLTESISRSGLV